LKVGVLHGIRKEISREIPGPKILTSTRFLRALNLDDIFSVGLGTVGLEACQNTI